MSVEPSGLAWTVPDWLPTSGWGWPVWSMERVWLS